MNVKTRPTLTGMLAVAAAGIFAAGTVADRANSLYGEADAGETATPAAYRYAAIDIDCRERVVTGCPEKLSSD